MVKSVVAGGRQLYAGAGGGLGARPWFDGAAAGAGSAGVADAGGARVAGGGRGAAQNALIRPEEHLLVISSTSAVHWVLTKDRYRARSGQLTHQFFRSLKTQAPLAYAMRKHNSKGITHAKPERHPNLV